MNDSRCPSCSADKAQGQPVTQVFPAYNPGVFNPISVPVLAIELKGVLEIVGNPNVVIVDPRPQPLFEATEQTFIRNGHIPGAINLTCRSITEANDPEEAPNNPHKLIAIEALRQLFVGKGVMPDTTVIICCSTGREASLESIVLTHPLGYLNVRLDQGSWTECNATDSPVQTGAETALKN